MMDRSKISTPYRADPDGLRASRVAGNLVLLITSALPSIS
jgi:hypothetical protein